MDGKRLRYRFAGWDLNLPTRRLTSAQARDASKIEECCRHRPAS
jgi:hypothetical protein